MTRPPHHIRRAAPGLLVLALSLGALAGLASRAFADEVRVPLDRDGRIDRVTAELARRTGLFLDRFPALEEAVLYQASDSSYTLEVGQVEGGRHLRTRVPLSVAGVDSLRDLVSERIRTLAPEAGRDQGGRPLLLTGTSLLGIGFYGWALPVVFDVRNGEEFGGLYLITAGACTILPLVSTQGREVTFPTASLGLYGATRGIAHGALIAMGMGWDSGRGILGAALAGSVAEAGLMSAWAQRSQMDGGTEASIVTGGDFGLLYGLGAADLFDVYDSDHGSAVAGLALAGSALGIVSGRALGRRPGITYGDAGVMRTAGYVGAYLGLGLLDAAGAEDHKPYVIATMAGSGLGLLVGSGLVAHRDFTGGQMVVANLVTGAGALVGLGIGVMAGANSDHSEHIIAPASALGAAAGLAVGCISVRPSLSGAADPSRWEIGLEPRFARSPGRAPARGASVVPTLAVRYRFD